MAFNFSHLRSWERSRPIVPKNHLISSEWGMRKKQPRFVPSYENEDKIDVAKLLSMEYARIWQIECAAWGDKRDVVDHKAARNAEWVIKWKKIQRGYRQADKQRSQLRQKNLRKSGPNCPCTEDKC